MPATAPTPAWHERTAPDRSVVPLHAVAPCPRHPADTAACGGECRTETLLAALVLTVEALVRHTGCAVQPPQWRPATMHQWLT